MSVTFKPLPPPIGSGGETGLWAYLKRVHDVIRGIQAGKLNATTTVTLTENVTTTTLTDARIGAASVILFMPTTSNAAGAMTNLYVSARAQGSATLTHSNTATTDRTFDVVILG
jgi:LDH2 family malate/lactate/ureidoglycolate dehydrogenase